MPIRSPRGAMPSPVMREDPASRAYFCGVWPQKRNDYEGEACCLPKNTLEGGGLIHSDFGCGMGFWTFGFWRTIFHQPPGQRSHIPDPVPGTFEYDDFPAETRLVGYVLSFPRG